MKKRIILIISLVVLLTIASLLYIFVYEDPYRGTMDGKSYQATSNYTDLYSYAQAKEDIDMVYEKIKERHYSTKDEVPEEIHAMYQDVIASLGEENTFSDVWISINRLLHTLNDGHARSGYVFTSSFKLYDLHLSIEDKDDWSIEIDGTWYKMLTLYGLPVEEIYTIASETFSYENIYYLHYLMESRLKYPIYETYFTGHIEHLGSVSYLKDNTVVEFTLMQTEEPQSIYEPVLYEIDLEHNVGYLNILSMRDDLQSKAAFKDFFTGVKENGIDNVVIDLQHNGGGNSLIIQDLMRYFPVYTYKDYGTATRLRLMDLSFSPKVRNNKIDESLAFHGQFYLITSARTFSSASMLTAIYKDNNLGLIYGEPMGNQPSMYGDILNYQLPNTKLVITLTYKLFTRPNGHMDDETIMPDVVMNPTLAYQYIVNNIQQP